MTDHPEVVDHMLLADRDRLRRENTALKARVAELEGVVGRGLEALQHTSGEPSSDFPGAIQ